MPDQPAPTVLVRPATPDDLHALDEFIKPFVDQKILIPRTFDELQELIRYGFVAESNARLVGFAALEVYSSKLGEIRSLAVDQPLLGQLNHVLAVEELAFQGLRGQALGIAAQQDVGAATRHIR